VTITMMPLHDDAVTGGGQWLLQPPGALGWPRRFGVQAIPALASSTATPQVDLAQDLVELLVPRALPLVGGFMVDGR
jgi:hypothetical protein